MRFLLPLPLPLPLENDVVKLENNAQDCRWDFSSNENKIVLKSQTPPTSMGSAQLTMSQEGRISGEYITHDRVVETDKMTFPLRTPSDTLELRVLNGQLDMLSEAVVLSGPINNTSPGTQKG